METLGGRGSGMRRRFAGADRMVFSLGQLLARKAAIYFRERVRCDWEERDG